MWNLWHGCHKFSEGCRYCYVYRGDAKRNVDSSVVVKTKNFDLPVRTNKNGSFKIPSGTLVYTCFTSDFFVEDADAWRTEAWEMIRQRSDLHFLMITKRINRVMECLPVDWKDGYDNVTICCTVENQLCADNRLPVYRAIPIKHKIIICEPLLEEISLDAYNIGEWVEQVVAGGESGVFHCTSSLVFLFAEMESFSGSQYGKGMEKLCASGGDACGFDDGKIHPSGAFCRACRAGAGVRGGCTGTWVK